MDYLYYPGCSLSTSGKAYDVSGRAVARVLGINLVELDDWNCCGTSPYFSARGLGAFSIAARNLAIAEKQGNGEMDLVTMCNSCYLTLSKTNHYFSEDERMKRDIAEVLNAAGRSYSGGVKVRHLLDVLTNDVGLEAVKAKVTRELSGLKVAAYYGCQMSRPGAEFDDPEFPMTMDNLLTALGADPVEFPTKAKCCGGMLMTTSQDVALKMVRDILSDAVENGAQCIATACPLCQMNLEAYQGDVNRKFGTDFMIPVVYFTQLTGMAMGLNRQEIDLGRELVPNTISLF